MCIPLFNNILNFFCFVKYRDINNLEKESQVKINVFGFFHFVRPSIVNDPLCPFFFNRSKKNYSPFSICIVCFSLNSSVKLFFSIRSFVYKNDRFSFLGKIVHPSFVFFWTTPFRYVRSQKNFVCSEKLCPSLKSRRQNWFSKLSYVYITSEYGLVDTDSPGSADAERIVG